MTKNDTIGTIASVATILGFVLTAIQYVQRPDCPNCKCKMQKQGRKFSCKQCGYTAFI